MRLPAILVWCVAVSACAHAREHRAAPRQLAAAPFTDTTAAVTAPSQVKAPYAWLRNELPEGGLAAKVNRILTRLAKDGANAELREELGKLLLENGYPGLAISPLQDAFYLRPGRLSLGALLAQAFVEAGRGEQALQLAKRLVDERPYQHGRWLFLAEIQRRLGLDDDALASAGRCLLINPSAGEARVILGYILADRGSAVLARKLLEEAAAQPNTDHKAIYHRLGQLSLQEDKLQEALDYLGRSAQEDGEFAAARNDLGVAYARLGRWTDAKREFEAAVKLDPALAEAQVNLANLLIDAGSKASARSAIEAAGKVGTDKAAYYVAAGRLFAMDVSTSTGRSQALSFFRKARALVSPETRAALDRAISKIESLPPPAEPRRIAPVQNPAPDREGTAAAPPSSSESQRGAEAPPKSIPARALPVESRPGTSPPPDAAESFRPSVD